MPRKLNKLPGEVMPSVGSRGIKENPTLEPTVLVDPAIAERQATGRKEASLKELAEAHKAASKAERKRADSAEEALRSHMQDEELVTGAELAQVRGMLQKKPESPVAQEMKQYQTAQKNLDKTLKKAQELGLSQAQFLQLLDNGPLEENESKSFFSGITTAFRRLAGQPWAGMDAKKLNELMSQYRESEKIIDAANEVAFEQSPKSVRPRNTPRDIPTSGGDSIADIKQSAKDMVNPETYTMAGAVSKELEKLKAEDENPAGTANALLEKYNVAIGKGKTIAKNGKLEYQSEGKEELSITDLINDQTLLNEAYNQILAKNKKDAKALVDAIGTIRYENRGSTLASENKTVGRGVAEGRKQANVGVGGMKVSSRGAGAASLDQGLSEQLQKLDTKKAKKELGNEDQEVAAEKALYEKSVQEIQAKADYLRYFSTEQAARVYTILTGKEPGPAEKANIVDISSNLFKSMALELSRLDSQTRSEIFEKDVDYDRKFKLEAAMDRVADYASKVTIGEAAAQEALEELTDADIEEISPAQAEWEKHNAKRKHAVKVTPPPVPKAKMSAQQQAKIDADMAEVAAMGRKNMKRMAAEDKAEFLADEDVISEDEQAPTKASETEIANFAAAMNARSGKNAKNKSKR
ncbi:MAG: hypothetical protein U0487_01345 [Patescibacteria group bacterium]